MIFLFYQHIARPTWTHSPPGVHQIRPPAKQRTGPPGPGRFRSGDCVANWQAQPVMDVEKWWFMVIYWDLCIVIYWDIWYHTINLGKDHKGISGSPGSPGEIAKSQLISVDSDPFMMINDVWLSLILAINDYGFTFLPRFTFWFSPKKLSILQPVSKAWPEKSIWKILRSQLWSSQTLGLVERM